MFKKLKRFIYTKLGIWPVKLSESQTKCFAYHLRDIVEEEMGAHIPDSEVEFALKFTSLMQQLSDKLKDPDWEFVNYYVNSKMLTLLTPDQRSVMMEWLEKEIAQ